MGLGVRVMASGAAGDVLRAAGWGFCIWLGKSVDKTNGRLTQADGLLGVRIRVKVRVRNRIGHL